MHLFKTTAADGRPALQSGWRLFDITSWFWWTSHHKRASRCRKLPGREKERRRRNVILIVEASGHRWHFVDLTTLLMYVGFAPPSDTSVPHVVPRLQNLWHGAKNQTHMLHLLGGCSPPEQKLVWANRWLAKLDNPIYYTAQWAESIYLIGQDGLYL